MSRDRFLPTLIDLLDHRVDIALSSMNCVSLGTVQSFDAPSQTATITVNYKRIIKNSKTAENGIDTVDEIREYPLLVKCPVFVLSGGVSSLTLPISQGDTCLLLFCDREIDTWFKYGVVTFPQSDRMHHLTDAVALIGIRSTQNPISNFNTLVASLIDQTGQRLMQAGMMVVFGGVTAPSGWVLCDGSSYSTTLYPILFSAIGYTWGGYGSSFNVPDMRGIFPRGIGTHGTLKTATGGPVTGPAMGAYQNDMFQGHEHTLPHNVLEGNAGGNPGFNSGGLYSPTGGAGDSGCTPNVSTPVTDGTDGTPRTGVETRPFNAGVNWIIKI